MPSRPCTDSFAVLSRISWVVTRLSFLLVVCLLLKIDDATAFALIPRLLVAAPQLVGLTTTNQESSIGMKSRPWTTTTMVQAQLSLNNPSRITDDPSLTDFSSPYFWEGFYKQQLLAANNVDRNQGTMEPSCVVDSTTNQNNDTNKQQQQPAAAFVHYDWHESIPLQDLANLIPAHSRCLMVGCGNSRLPQVVLDRHGNNVHMTLLDNSPTCVEQLKVLYRKQNKQVDCVCASATAMSSYFEQQQQQRQHDNSSPSWQVFDMIVDKGLIDAFMCGDAWEGSVEDLFRESTRVLNTDVTDTNGGGGMYLLVSYKISRNVQDVIQQLTNKIGGDSSVEWCWDFDIESLSNHRVSVSMARVRSTQRNKTK
jgi:Methyltransferase domain